MPSKTLKQIAEKAELQLTPEQVELALDLSENYIPNNEAATRAYRTGKAAGLAKIRAALMQEVDSGSVQAAKLMCEYADESEPEYE